MNYPSWHKRPTGPGLWVCIKSLENDGAWRGTALKLNAIDLQRGAPFETQMVYGPIPEPKEMIDAGQVKDEQPSQNESDSAAQVCEAASGM